MVRRSSTVVQRVWDRKARVYRHRLVRQFVKTRIGRKPKLTEAEQLFARA